MTRKLKGDVAEAKVLSELISEGFEVFVPFSANASVDLIALREGTTHRVSVKYTSSMENAESWRVELRNKSRRRDSVMVTKEYDSDHADIIAVYVAPLDQVILVDAAQISSRTAISVRVDDTRLWLP